MSEIKCPHCGEVFKVDEQGYAAIVAQVKTAEFDKELDKRVADEKDKALSFPAPLYPKHSAWLGTFFQSMVNRIFHEGLENHFVDR